MPLYKSAMLRRLLKLDDFQTLWTNSEINMNEFPDELLHTIL